MRETPAETVIADQGGGTYPIARYGAADRPVAIRDRRGISLAEFTSNVTALATRLPDHRYVLNLCRDRYRFMVGFAAALKRGQVSLMPSSDAPGVLAALAEDYPDLYALTDGTPPALPSFPFPDDLAAAPAAADALEVPGDQPALVLFTSGSTGRPKPVPKSWGALVRSALAAGARLDATKLRTVIGTVPHQHSYGLESTVMLALQHGLTLETFWPLYPADIRATIAASARPSLLVTTPVHLRALVAEPEEMPHVDLILSATAPLPHALAVKAEARFAAPLIEIYGCTEAGQVATRRSAEETDWRCFEGVNLRQDEEGSWASGPAVEGIALLQDIIEPTGPDTFRLGDRPADLVDVAGKRASIANLNHQLLNISGVKDGAFLMGEAAGNVTRLLALVVAPGLQPETILQALRQSIDPAFLPRPLIFVDTLPRNSLGKLPREALLRLAAQHRRAK